MRFTFLLLSVLLLLFPSCASVASSSPNNSSLQSISSALSKSDKQKLAKAIWRNECGGTIQGLTTWNQGEDFPSLGIGHFIWYPAGKEGIYQESFPAFIAYAKKAGATPPSWLGRHSPWNTRSEFLKDMNGTRLTELRKWLASTTELQTDFIIARSIASLPKLKASSKDPKTLEGKFKAVASTPNGMYALVDYVNFKGEGTNPSERYKGEGWGLAQVFDSMPNVSSGQTAVQAFSSFAKKVLSRRVANSPPERNETRWLAGWHNRCNTYTAPL